MHFRVEIQIIPQINSSNIDPSLSLLQFITYSAKIPNSTVKDKKKSRNLIFFSVKFAFVFNEIFPPRKRAAERKSQEFLLTFFCSFQKNFKSMETFHSVSNSNETFHFICKQSVEIIILYQQKKFSIACKNHIILTLARFNSV
jgi:hypothetical protein